ncbi:hypothetical protein F0562_034384 [Nyssa sinensis]|uniref:Reverse transcriptase/retrotransposon-derived protein RNase H-like domain-containing protein n=1 Tax=Nyssa sinensis TaxID=561372 RepID=A0A5J5AK25_9ASTE|nr:hypothetical protein F0562_034384 [Nyssa sinensis]
MVEETKLSKGNDLIMEEEIKGCLGKTKGRLEGEDSVESRAIEVVGSSNSLSTSSGEHTDWKRKFVQNYGILACPLTNLLKKGQFGWNEEAEAAFITLKQVMTTTPTLIMPDFNEAFTIETDASGDGIGVVLTQHDKIIAFMRRALGVSKRSWSTYAKEMLAIVEAIRTRRPYLLRRRFLIQTDQRNLKYFLEQRVATPK